MPGYSAKCYSFKEIGNAASNFYTAELAEISASMAEEDWLLIGIIVTLCHSNLIKI